MRRRSFLGAIMGAAAALVGLGRGRPALPYRVPCARCGGRSEAPFEIPGEPPVHCARCVLAIRLANPSPPRPPTEVHPDGGYIVPPDYMEGTVAALEADAKADRYARRFFGNVTRPERS